MRANLFKLMPSTFCLLIVVFGLFRLSILTTPSEERDFLHALNARKAPASSFTNLRDISVYTFRLPECGFDAILYVSNFASMKAFEEMSDLLPGRVQRFYLGYRVTSFDTRNLWPRYITHQVASKLGLASDTTWDQKLVVEQIDAACQSSQFGWSRPDVLFQTHIAYLDRVASANSLIRDSHLFSARSRE